MVEIEVNGSTYSGRFVTMEAQEKPYYGLDGVVYYKNVGYYLQIMDANGVRMNFTLDNLNQITFVG